MMGFVCVKLHHPVTGCGGVEVDQEDFPEFVCGNSGKVEQGISASCIILVCINILQTLCFSEARGE